MDSFLLSEPTNEQYIGVMDEEAIKAEIRALESLLPTLFTEQQRPFEATRAHTIRTCQIRLTHLLQQANLLTEHIDLYRIQCGLDPRIKIMLKNIPYWYRHDSLTEYINSHCIGFYDDIDLRVDSVTNNNMGYAFITVKDPAHIIRFFQAFNEKIWPDSNKIIRFVYARIQPFVI